MTKLHEEPTPNPLDQDGASASLARQILRLSAVHEISNLQARYIYFLQSHEYGKIVELFARRSPVSVEMDDLGCFLGKEKVEKVFLQVLKPLYMTTGAMGLHMLSTPLIEVAEDCRSAWGMWHTFGCNTQPDFVADNKAVNGQPELIAMWQQGKYHIDFVHEDGRWCISNFRWYTNFRTPFDKGWVKQPITGNLSVVAKLFPGCPEPDRASHYDPFNPNGLTQYLPLPVDG